MEKYLKNLLGRLEALRAGRTVTAFAKACDVPQQTMANYCKGERIPSLEALVHLCTANVVSADWMLGFTDDRAGHSAPASDTQNAKKVVELEKENSLLRAQIEGLKYALDAIGKGGVTASARRTALATGA